jgi:hypothetical protein
MRRVDFCLVAGSLLVLALLPACTQPAPPTIQIDGTFVSAAGAPRSGLRVIVDGGSTRTTGQDGRFAATEVRATYDLVGFDTLPDFVHAFEGATSAVPVVRLGDEVFGTLTPPLAPTGVVYRATVQVTLPIAVAADTTAIVCGESGDAIVTGCLRVAGIASTGPYDWDLRWYGSDRIDLKMHVLYVGTSSSGLPIAYPHYTVDALPSSLEAGGTATFAFNAGPPPAPNTGTLDVTVRSPDLLANTRVSVLARISERLAMPLTPPNQAEVPRGATRTIPVPVIGDGGFDVVGRALIESCPPTNPLCTARAVAWRVDQAPSDAIELVLGAPPLILNPEASVEPPEIGLDTILRVSERLDGIVTFFAITEPPLLPTVPQFAVSVAGTTSTLPDPTGLGFSVPSGTRYILFAVVAPDVEDPTAWLDAFGPLVTAELSGGPGATSDGELIFTQSRIVAIR